MKKTTGTQRDPGTNTGDACSLMDHSDGVPHLPASLHSPGHRETETHALGGSFPPATDILQAMGTPRDRLDTGGFTAILTSTQLERARNPQGISGKLPKGRGGASLPEDKFRVRKEVNVGLAPVFT